MTVYVVLCDIDFEGTEVDSVWLREEDANTRAKEIDVHGRWVVTPKYKFHMHYDNTRIEPHELKEAT